jgi:hypothetical protein
MSLGHVAAAERVETSEDPRIECGISYLVLEVVHAESLSEWQSPIGLFHATVTSAGTRPSARWALLWTELTDGGRQVVDDVVALDVKEKKGVAGMWVVTSLVRPANRTVLLG